MQLVSLLVNTEQNCVIILYQWTQIRLAGSQFIGRIYSCSSSSVGGGGGGGPAVSSTVFRFDTDQLASPVADLATNSTSADFTVYDVVVTTAHIPPDLRSMSQFTIVLK